MSVQGRPDCRASSRSTSFPQPPRGSWSSEASPMRLAATTYRWTRLKTGSTASACSNALEPDFVDDPLVGYRTGVASMSTDTQRMERAIAAVLEKHRDLRSSLAVEPDWAAIHRSLLAADLLTSRRFGRARAFKLFRVDPTVKNAARCIVIPVARNRISRASAARRRAKYRRVLGTPGASMARRCSTTGGLTPVSPAAVHHETFPGLRCRSLSTRAKRVT